MQILQEVVNVEGQVQHSPEKTGEEYSQSACLVNSENAVIAARLRANDASIVDELILRYQERLRRYLIRFTGDRDLAEDILQEAWMRVVTRGSQFNGNSQFATWLFAVARNLVRDQQRRKMIQAGSLEVITREGDEMPLDVASTDSTPFEHFAELECKQALRDALRALMPHHREVLELRFLHELSLKEISCIIGTPVSTVKARLYRALTALKPRMQANPLPVSTTLRLAS